MSTAGVPIQPLLRAHPICTSIFVHGHRFPIAYVGDKCSICGRSIFGVRLVPTLIVLGRPLYLPAHSDSQRDREAMTCRSITFDE